MTIGDDDMHEAMHLLQSQYPEPFRVITNVMRHSDTRDEMLGALLTGIGNALCADTPPDKDRILRRCVTESKQIIQASKADA